ncbi:MAG: hypothetical protein ACTS47_01365 [Candidatus Hodgkinia cicadicola]
MKWLRLTTKDCVDGLYNGSCQVPRLRRKNLALTRPLEAVRTLLRGLLKVLERRWKVSCETFLKSEGTKWKMLKRWENC